jgi:hypothetical protein
VLAEFAIKRVDPSLLEQITQLLLVVAVLRVETIVGLTRFLVPLPLQLPLLVVGMVASITHLRRQEVLVVVAHTTLILLGHQELKQIAMALQALVIAVVVVVITTYLQLQLGMLLEVGAVLVK